MIGFESFDVRHWLDNGLTQHIGRRRSVLRVHKKRINDEWRRRMVLPIFASAGVAVSVFSTTPSAAPERISWIEYVLPVAISIERDSDVIHGSPAVFWTRQIEKVRALKRDAIQSVQDPPTHF